MNALKKQDWLTGFALSSDAFFCPDPATSKLLSLLLTNPSQKQAAGQGTVITLAATSAILYSLFIMLSSSFNSFSVKLLKNKGPGARHDLMMEGMSCENPKALFAHIYWHIALSSACADSTSQAQANSRICLPAELEI